MAQSKTVMVTCPNCGKEFEMILYESINTSADIEVVKSVKEGNLFLHQCPHCKEEVQMIYPTLYHVQKEKDAVMIRFLPTTNEELIAREKAPYIEFAKVMKETLGHEEAIRFVNLPQELAEKAMIFDLGLDDRVIELVKLLMLVNMDNGSINDIPECYFYVDGEKQFLIAHRADGQEGILEIPEGFYEGIARNYASYLKEFGKPREKEFDIDRVWAIDFLNHVKNLERILA